MHRLRIARLRGSFPLPHSHMFLDWERTNVPAFMRCMKHPQQSKLLQRSSKKQQGNSTTSSRLGTSSMGTVCPEPQRMAQFPPQQQQHSPRNNTEVTPTITATTAIATANPQPMMLQAQRSLFTPQPTSHGLPYPTQHSIRNRENPPLTPHVPSTAHMPRDDTPRTERSGRSIHSVTLHTPTNPIPFPPTPTPFHSRGSHSPSYELGLGLACYMSG